MNEDFDLDRATDKLLTVAESAAAEFRNYSTAQVEKIVAAVAAAADEQAAFYAEWAVRETGFGDVEDKTVKNVATSSVLIGNYNIADFVEPKVDFEKKVIAIPKPAGVVIAVLPCTNPIMTVNFKIIANLIARNAVILCPHPAARESSVHASQFLAEAAEKAGAPKGSVQVLTEPSIPVVNILMQSPRTNLIMATGGPGLVHAAYSSGNPAVGVGPANVPCYVHESANLEKAGADIVIGNSFDNSLPCTCESLVLADSSITQRLKETMSAGGGLFVADEESRKLREYLFPGGEINVEAMGKSPHWIGERAGVPIDKDIRSIVFEIDDISQDEPMSREKMFPVLGFLSIEGGIDTAIDKALATLALNGEGHSAVIHSEDTEVVLRYSKALPVCRIAVNTPGVTGSSGMSSNLMQTCMIGTGFFGGTSSGDNIGPQHVVQYTYAGYDSSDEVQMGEVSIA